MVFKKDVGDLLNTERVIVYRLPVYLHLKLILRACNRSNPKNIRTYQCKRRVIKNPFFTYTTMAITYLV